MAEKGRLINPADGAVVYPQTLTDCIQNESGELLENLVLMKDNSTQFVPTDTYQPATKGYVDTKVVNEISNAVKIDSVLSSSSTNPVQNKVINTELGNKQAKITANGLLKGNGSGTVSAATSGIDYAPGGFGLGNNCKVITGEDLHTVAQQTGFYSGKTVTNAPKGSTAWFYYLVMRIGATNRKILAFTLESNIIWCQTSYSNNGVETWSAWQQVFPAVYSS